MTLYFYKQSSSSNLKSFYCGVEAMDSFIHNDLDEVLKNPQYNMYVVKNDDENVVAMFVFSEGAVILDKDKYLEEGIDGSDYAILCDNEINVKTCYRTLEIDYLAVSSDYRNKQIGSTIIKQLSLKAKDLGKHFLTVDAYFDSNYSAIDFYQKNGFVAVENLDASKNTLRMYSCVI